MKSVEFDPEYHIPLAAKYALEGLINIEIAKKLGISKTTFYKWCKTYPNFANSIRQNKLVADFEVEQSLYKRAIGFEYEEVKTKVLAVKTITKDGETIEKHPILIEKTKKYIPPDVTACLYWLKNRDPEHWRDKPEKESDADNGTLGDLVEALRNIKRA